MGRPRIEWQTDERYQNYLNGLREGLRQGAALISAGFNGNALVLTRIRDRDPEFIVAETEARRRALFVAGKRCPHCGAEWSAPRDETKEMQHGT